MNSVEIKQVKNGYIVISSIEHSCFSGTCVFTTRIGLENWLKLLLNKLEELNGKETTD